MVLKILEDRHSLRAYAEAKKISEEQILELAKAARIAPSCYNDQPWIFLFCQKEKDKEGWKKVFDALVEFNQGWAKEADLLIVVLARMTFLKNGKENRWGPYDSGAAAMSLVLQAVQLGLMAHQMGGFDEGKIKASFDVPKNWIPYSVIAVGIEKEGVTIPAKDRLPIEDNFFRGDLKTPFKNL